MAATAGVVAAGLVAAGVVAQSARRVRQMRATGATVPPLAHDIDLPGRFPPRWLVVLGDSAAAGHGLPDASVALPRLVGEGLRVADGRATAVRSVAVDGATTAKILERQLDAVRDAEVVVVGVGVNDAVRPRLPVHEVAAATRVLLEGVLGLAAPGARVVLLSCPDLSAAPGLPAVLRPIVGWRCRAVAAAQADVAGRLGVPVVAAARSDVRPELFGPDGFHPGVGAHALLADRVLDALR